MMDARKIQSLRNLGNEAEEAAAEIDRLTEERDRLAEALRHMRWCRNCAEGSWDDCEGGREAIDALESIK